MNSYMLSPTQTKFKHINMSHDSMPLRQEELVRPTGNFHPSVWGDQFLIYEEVCNVLQTIFFICACLLQSNQW